MSSSSLLFRFSFSRKKKEVGNRNIPFRSRWSGGGGGIYEFLASWEPNCFPFKGWIFFFKGKGEWAQVNWAEANSWLGCGLYSLLIKNCLWLGGFGIWRWTYSTPTKWSCQKQRFHRHETQIKLFLCVSNVKKSSAFLHYFSMARVWQTLWTRLKIGAVKNDRQSLRVGGELFLRVPTRRGSR